MFCIVGLNEVGILAAPYLIVWGRGSKFDRFLKIKLLPYYAQREGWGQTGIVVEAAYPLPITRKQFVKIGLQDESERELEVILRRSAWKNSKPQVRDWMVIVDGSGGRREKCEKTVQSSRGWVRRYP
jgi:hypothetical protein